jgi:hypothetical protein
MRMMRLCDLEMPSRTSKHGLTGIVKFLGILALIILVVGAGFYVAANVFDWKITWFGINPPDTEQTIIASPFTYPPPSGGIMVIGGNIILEVKIDYNGTLVERKPANLKATGTLDPELASQIQWVEVYFEGAMPYPMSPGDLYFGYAGVVLYPSNQSQPTGVSLGAYLVGNPVAIDWQVQGDYYLTLEIAYTNFTVKDQTYQDYRVHVSPADVLEQARYSRINTALSISLVLFAFVESIAFIGRLVSRKNSKESNNNGSYDTAHKPKTNPKKEEKPPNVKAKQQEEEPQTNEAKTQKQ